MANSLVPGSAIRSDLNTYIVRSVLGSGGFGITYSATYSTDINGLPVKVVVAVKEFFMSQDCERDSATGSVTVASTARERTESAMKDFIGEANRLKSISGGHRNIIRVSEVFMANNTAYYVMEFVEGTSLDAYVKARGPLTEAQTVTLMRPIIEATAFLHRNRITHLDIKPANIMLSADADGGTRPVLIDFGLSKHYDETGQATSTINTMGHSEGYSPIEQYTGIRSFSPASDVYSLGATMYFCLTGQRPPVASELNTADIDAQLAARGITPALRHAICRALSLRIADRPDDAAVFLELIKNRGSHAEVKLDTQHPDPAATRIFDISSQISEPQIPRQPSTRLPKTEPVFINDEPKPRKHRTWVWILLAVVLLAGLGIGAYFMFGKKEPGFESGIAYEFTTTGDMYDAEGTFDCKNMIVPADYSEGYPRYLWCIQTEDGYWAPITYGSSDISSTDGPVRLYFNPNSCISWYKGDGNNIGFSLTANRVEGGNLIITTGNEGEEMNQWIAEAIFGNQTEFVASPTDFKADNSLLAGTTWVYRDTESENAFEFGDIIVNKYYTDFYDGYQNVSGSGFIAYEQNGVTKVCFVSGDNPTKEVTAGYVEGDKMYLHRTGICLNGRHYDEVVVFDRYYGPYEQPANPYPAPPGSVENDRK